MTFDEFWTAANLGDALSVRDGTPSPSNVEGNPYKMWKSHNFDGILREKVTADGWRYLRIEVDPDETPEEVEFLAYDVAEGIGHTFTPL